MVTGFMRNVLDLFSGIGGFSYGLEMTGGFKTVAFCEIDPFCQKVLRKHWPSVPIFEDIKELHREDISETIDIIVGGFPCQPVSVAGKRKGTEDNRWLWPEMFRVIKEFKPTWVIGENVTGIISMGQPVGLPVVESRRITRTKDYDYYEAIFTRQEELLFRNICQDLEKEGYEVQPLVIPACAVGAPTEEIGFGFLPTPAAQDPGWKNIEVVDKNGRPPTHPNQRFYDKRTGRLVQKGLTQVVRMWPTPSVCGNYNRKGASKTSGDGPATAVKKTMWPTPTARDWKSGRGHKKRQYSELTPLVERQSPSGNLNPTWVEWLMGYPLYWTYI